MKKLCMYWGLIFSAFHLQAQQDPYFTHFAYNRILYNPAYSGATGGACLSMVHHKQWLQLPDQTGLYRTESGLMPLKNVPGAIGPVTSAAAVSLPVIGKNGTGLLGVSMAAMTDDLAYEYNSYFNFGIATGIPLRNSGELRVGAGISRQTKSWNAGALRAMDMPDPLLPVPGTPGSTRNLLSGGIYLNLPAFYSLRAGISSTGINRVTFDYLNAGGSRTLWQSARHYYLFASWEYGQIGGNPNWTLNPNVFIRAVNAGNGWVPPQADVQALATWNGSFSTGAGIRAQRPGLDAASILAAVYPLEAVNSRLAAAHKLRIGMSYDFTLQSLRLSSRNTWELQVNYCYKLTDIIFCRLKKWIHHPREIAPHQFITSGKTPDF